jgi:hypothetical protein
MNVKTKARVAGFLYLIIIVGGIFAQIGVRDRLVVSGDATATAHKILAHELLYRFGFDVEVFYLATRSRWHSSGASASSSGSRSFDPRSFRGSSAR